MAQHNQQRAFVLHSWPYRETSLLLDLFTEQNGRIRLLAKGARRRHSTRFSCLQPFTPLQVNWYGQNELKILQQAEPISLALPLMGHALYSGFYVNELLYRLLVPEAFYHTLFNDYLHCLCQLAIGPQACEPGLRCFELALLQALGYGINFSYCADSGEPVIESALYRYTPEHGFVKDPMVGPLSFSGYQLRALAERHFPTTETLRAAKSFTRLAIKPYLGNKPLKSRELFGQHYQKLVHPQYKK